MSPSPKTLPSFGPVPAHTRWRACATSSLVCSAAPGRSTSLLPSVTTPATPPDPSPPSGSPSHEPGSTRERRSPAYAADHLHLRGRPPAPARQTTSTRAAEARQPSGAGAAGQVGQLAVEALGLLQKRGVADAVVPGGLGGWAGRQHMLGHRRQHDRVGGALGGEERHVAGGGA